MSKLGWAIYQGPEFKRSEQLTYLHKKFPDNSWKSISRDPDRKWIDPMDMMHMTAPRIKLLEPFRHTKQELLSFVVDHIFRFDRRKYDSDYWTIMKNDGKSDGQDPHTDYPLVHNPHYMEQNNKKTNGIDKDDDDDGNDNINGTDDLDNEEEVDEEDNEDDNEEDDEDEPNDDSWELLGEYDPLMKNFVFNGNLINRPRPKRLLKIPGMTTTMN